jgi:hypothetical protein
VVLLWSTPLYFQVVNGAIVMVSYFVLLGSHWQYCYVQLLYTFRQSMVAILMASCFTLSGSQWWHCYAQLLYSFRQSVVVFLCSSALYFQAVNGGIVMVSFFSNFLSCTDTATLHDVIGMSVYLIPPPPESFASHRGNAVFSFWFI